MHFAKLFDYVGRESKKNAIFGPFSCRMSKQAQDAPICKNLQNKLVLSLRRTKDMTEGMANSSIEI